MANGRGASRPHLRFLPTVLLALAILALPTAVYAWGRSSASFSIERVVVTGDSLVKERRLKRLLREDYLGRNVFTVTNEDVRKTLKPLPYVATATVDRDFPVTLRVHVQEHKPVAYVRSGDRWFVVSNDAYVITELKTTSRGTATSVEGGDGERSGDGSPSPSPEGTPAKAAQAATTSATGAVEGTSGDPADAQELQDGPPNASLRLPRFAVAPGVEAASMTDDPSARVAVGAITGLTSALRDRLEVVEVDRGQVTFHFASGLRAVWGDGDRPLAKRAALRAVLKRYKARDVRATYVDVSTPDRVLAQPMLQ